MEDSKARGKEESKAREVGPRSDFTVCARYFSGLAGNNVGGWTSNGSRRALAVLVRP